MSGNDAKYEIREGKFALCKSTIEHEDGKNHPDMFAYTKIEGKKYKIAGWTQESQAGNKYVSCTIQPVLVDESEEPETATTSKDIFDE